MTDELRFIHDIEADPEDIGPPLVYADWLEENGQTDRARLIRAEVRRPGAESSEEQLSDADQRELKVRCTAAFGAVLLQKMTFRWERGLAEAELAEDARLTAADMREMARFPYLTTLRRFENLTPTQLGHLSLCPNVHRLHYYSNRPLTARHWQTLVKLSHIEGLVLWYAEGNITDACLPHIAAMAGLRELNLEDAPVTDGAVGVLAALTGLEVLNLARTRVTDAGLAFLPSLTRLRVLDLNHTDITDATVGRLVSLPALTSLDIGDTQVADPVTAVLRLPTLRSVGMRRLEVTDSHLPQLLRLPHLRDLDLRLTNVTRFRLARLLPQPKWRKVRLECRIGNNDAAEDREIDAFKEFCKEHDLLVDVDWE